MRPDLDVERHLRRRIGEVPADLAERLGGLGDLGQRAPRVLQAALEPAQRADRRARDGLGVAREQRRGRRLGPGDPLVLVLGGLGHRLDVEEDRRDVDSRDAVDERVVGLGHEREALAGQALDHPDLPQRLGAVELLGEDASRHVAQLLLGARRRQGRMAHVVFEVERRVVDPERAAGGDRGEGELLAEARDEVKARPNVVEQVFVAGWRALEDADPADVHMRGGALVGEERDVERRQPVHVRGRHAA